MVPSFLDGLDMLNHLPEIHFKKWFLQISWGLVVMTVSSGEYLICCCQAPEGRIRLGHVSQSAAPKVPQVLLCQKWGCRSEWAVAHLGFPPSLKEDMVLKLGLFTQMLTWGLWALIFHGKPRRLPQVLLVSGNVCPWQACAWEQSFQRGASLSGSSSFQCPCVNSPPSLLCSHFKYV